MAGNEQQAARTRYDIWTPRHDYRPMVTTERTRPATPSDKLPVGIAYTVARALTEQESDGWTPVAPNQPKDEILPTIDCVTATIRRTDGTTLRLNRNDLDEDHWRAGTYPRPGERAEAISLELRIGYEGDEDAAVRLNVETDLLAGGRYWDEAVWATQDHCEDDETLAESLFSAYWHDAANPLRESERETDDYDSYCITMAVRINRGEEQGFRTELQRTVNCFSPQSQLPAVAMRHRAGDRHIISWQPVRGADGHTAASLDMPEAVTFGEIVRDMYPDAGEWELARIYRECLDAYAQRPELRAELVQIAREAGRLGAETPEAKPTGPESNRDDENSKESPRG